MAIDENCLVVTRYRGNPIVFAGFGILIFEP